MELTTGLQAFSLTVYGSLVIQMEIKAILVPCDEGEEPQLITYEQGDYKAIQRAVGGTFDVVDIPDPALSLWLHDEGKVIGLDVNHRATMMHWLADSRWRGQDILVGPILITGQPDEEGDTTSIPDEFVKLIFNTPEYKVEMKMAGTGEWKGDAQEFLDYFSACRYAIEFLRRHRTVVDARVVAV